MKPILLTLLAAATLSVSAMAQQPAAKVQPAPTSAPVAGVQSRAQAEVNFGSAVAAIYDERTSKIPSYYVILSSDPDASYNSKTGAIENLSNGYLLTLDLYADPSSPIALPDGVYAANGSGMAMSYDPEYSFLAYYDAQGTQTASALLSDFIRVSSDQSGIYTITTTIHQGADDLNITFKGRLPFVNANEKPSAFPQVKHDVEVDMNGGVAFYQGIPESSGQGATYLNLYSNGFDPETGAMTEAGSSIAILFGHKKFLKKEDFTIIPGTYEVSYSLNRFTWYPGREIDYVGTAMPFGTYYRELIIDNEVTMANHFEYGYMRSGTFTVDKAEGNLFSGSFEGVTDLGYTIKINFEGEVTFNWQDAKIPAAVSNLTDDVEMDFSKIEMAHVFHTGMMGGCRTFIVDLGSPAGRDEAINYGGDLFRMELFLNPKYTAVQPGTYTVVPRRWNSNELAAGRTYSPFSCNKGRFNENGSSTGTRYTHFKEGSYCVEDLHGPAEEGSIGITVEENGDYTFDINIMDDAGWYITGKWTGPLDLLYDEDALKASIGEVGADGGSLEVAVEGTTLTIDAEGVATLYNLAGSAVRKGQASEGLDIAGLPAGIYILKVNNKVTKLTL